MPISLSLWLGRRLGSVVFIINKKRRLIAYANLKAAFGKEKTPRDLRRLVKSIYKNLLQTFIEVLNLTKVNKRYIEKYIEIANYERVKEAHASGRGTILLTGHFGNWELLSLVSALIGYPILVLAREQKMKRLNELLNRLRESKGCRVIRKGISTKNILRALYDKDMVGILSDQDAGKNGIFVDFFGRPTSCHAGPMEMAKRTDSIILPNFIARVKGPYQKIFLEEFIDFRQSGNAPEDIKENLQKFAYVLESYIRRYPDQWLWLHKRWKSTPVRKVLVLNDGRKGHLNQSLAIASAIQRARMTQGYKLEDTEIVVIDVKFKNGFSRTLLSACSLFATWRCHGCMRCMRLCLEEKTYEALMRAYSEFVVSCGSGLAAVNIFMSKENNAKNIVVMEPNIIMGLKKFNLAVIPKHDRPPKAKNIVETLLAPNLIEEGRLKKDGESLLRDIRLENPDKVMGLLVGGDNPEYTMTERVVNEVIDGALKFCEEMGAELLVTTSRRTSRVVEDILRNRLSANPKCRLLVIANEKNLDVAVTGILGLSKVVIVSGESISMVSEAISSGKKVIAFELEKEKNVATKHGKALRDLERQGYLVVAKPVDLYRGLKDVWRDFGPIKRVDDKERIFEAVRRLI